MTGDGEQDRLAGATGSWLGPRSRDGGIDRLPLPGRAGAVSLCGKHAVGPDPEAALARAGACTIVCLTERHELADRYPRYVDWLGEHVGDRAVWFPIPDLHAPGVDAVTPLLDELHRRLATGEHLLVHCAAGIGRAGTIAACLLVELGVGHDEALATVAAHRPMAGPEVGAQQELVAAVARRARRPLGVRRPPGTGAT